MRTDLLHKWHLQVDEAIASIKEGDVDCDAKVMVQLHLEDVQELAALCDLEAERDVGHRLMTYYRELGRKLWGVFKEVTP